MYIKSRIDQKYFRNQKIKKFIARAISLIPATVETVFLAIVAVLFYVIIAVINLM